MAENIDATFIMNRILWTLVNTRNSYKVIPIPKLTVLGEKSKTTLANLHKQRIGRLSAAVSVKYDLNVRFLGIKSL